MKATMLYNKIVTHKVPAELFRNLGGPENQESGTNRRPPCNPSLNWDLLENRNIRLVVTLYTYKPPSKPSKNKSFSPVNSYIFPGCPDFLIIYIFFLLTYFGFSDVTTNLLQKILYCTWRGWSLVQSCFIKRIDYKLPNPNFWEKKKKNE